MRKDGTGVEGREGGREGRREGGKEGGRGSTRHYTAIQLLKTNLAPVLSTVAVATTGSLIMRCSNNNATQQNIRNSRNSIAGA